jgi:hypothetical protein
VVLDSREALREAVAAQPRRGASLMSVGFWIFFGGGAAGRALMLAFPDVNSQEAARAAKCLRKLWIVERLAHKLQTEHSEPLLLPEDDALSIVPGKAVARWLALAGVLLVIHRLEGLDFRFKTFYDVTGSGGAASLAAALLYQWSSIKSFEPTVSKFGDATALRRAAQLLSAGQAVATETSTQPVLLTAPAQWHICNTNFKAGDYMDGDVLLFDATQFGSLDEGVPLHYASRRMRALQAGSFVIVLSHCAVPLLLPRRAYKQLYCRPVPYAGGGELLYAWLFRTLLASDDIRIGGCFDDAVDDDV